MIATCPLLRAAGGERRSASAWRGGPLSQQGLAKEPPPSLIAGQLYLLQAVTAATNWLMNNFQRAGCGCGGGVGLRQSAAQEGVTPPSEDCVQVQVRSVHRRNPPPHYPQGTATPRLSDLKGSVKDQAGLLFISPVFFSRSSSCFNSFFFFFFASAAPKATTSQPQFFLIFSKVMVACFPLSSSSSSSLLINWVRAEAPSSMAAAAAAGVYSFIASLGRASTSQLNHTCKHPVCRSLKNK